LANKAAIWLHWLFLFLLAVVFALEIVSLAFSLSFVDALDAALVVIAAASTLAAMSRRLPVQNVLMAGFGAGVIGGGLWALDTRTGLPFGSFIYTAGAGSPLFETMPLAMPLLWIFVVLNSRGVSRMILRPWRKTKSYGYRVVGLTAILALVFDLAFEPFAFRVRHYWLWEPTKLPLTWDGAPALDFLAWGLVTVLILLFITPALINKRPRSRWTPDYHPLCMWLGGVLFFGAACAAHGIWLAVLADAVIIAAVTTFTLRGAKW